MGERPLPAIGAVLQQENVAPGDFADIGYALTPLRLAQGYLDVGSNPGFWISNQGEASFF